VHSHGSVGLDETLDWYVNFEFPGLTSADLTGRPLLKLLSDKPSLHITGTLSQPKLNAEGLAEQALKSGIDLLLERRKQRIENGTGLPRPGLLPGRRGSDIPPPADQAK
jgi:hypothetical protein